MKLRKLTSKDEYLKLDGLVNDKEVNECIEENCIEQFREDRRIYEKGRKQLDKKLREKAEAQADLQIMTDRNEALKKSKTVV